MSEIATEQFREQNSAEAVRLVRQPVKADREAALRQIRELLERNARLVKAIRKPLDLRRTTRE